MILMVDIHVLFQQKWMTYFELTCYVGDPLKAKTLIGHLSKIGFRLDDAIVASLISLYGKQNNLKDAQEVF